MAQTFQDEDRVSRDKKIIKNLEQYRSKEFGAFSRLLSDGLTLTSGTIRSQKFGVRGCMLNDKQRALKSTANLQRVVELPRKQEGVVHKKIKFPDVVSPTQKNQLVGFNLVVLRQGRTRFKQLSLQQSLELVEKYNFLHLHNYFRTRIQIQEGEILLNDNRISFQYHQLDDPRIVYKPFINFETELYVVNIQMPGFQIEFCKKIFFCRAQLYRLLRESVWRQTLKKQGSQLLSAALLRNT